MSTRLLRHSRAGAFGVIFAGTSFLASCGGNDPTPTPTAVPAATAFQAVSTATANVEPVVWAERIASGTNQPMAPVERFSSSAPTIYAVTHVSDLPEGAVLSASWTYNDTPLERVTRAVIPAESYRRGYVEFHLSRTGEQNWPAGRYEITISLDGDVVQTATVEVVD